MGETADRIVADIAETRDAMNRDLRALKIRLKQEANLRTQARRHPWLLVSVAAGLLFAGMMFVRALRR